MHFKSLHFHFIFISSDAINIPYQTRTTQRA